MLRKLSWRGLFDPRAYAVQQMLLQEKDRIAEATARAGGIDQTSSFVTKFLEGYDFKAQSEKVFNYRQQMAALILLIKN